MATKVIVAVGAFVVPSFAEEVSPIGKAIQMLGDLQAKLLLEGEDSQKVYNEFAEWCEESSANLQHDIKNGKSEIMDLTAAVDKEVATVGALNAKVEQLSGDLAADEADLKAAAEVRNKEHEAFLAEEKELAEVVDTLKHAVGILERESKGGASLVQLSGVKSLVQAMSSLVQASMLSTAEADTLQSFLQSQSSDEDGEPGAPEAAAYEGHSGNIIETISDLLDKAEEQLDAARQKEATDLHAFQMTEQALKSQLKLGAKELDEAKIGISVAEEKKATSAGDLQVTQKDLSTDESALSELHHECMTKAQDFETQTKVQGEELNALAAAKKVLQETTGEAASLSYGDEAASLLQTSARAGPADFKVAHLLRDLARRQGSRALALLAQKVGAAAQASARSGTDGFDKIKALIQDMIERLQQEAEADATKKVYCDKELAETNSKKDDKTTEIEKLSTQIDQMTTHSAKLKGEVAELQKALSALSTSKAQLDKMRGEDNALYKKNKAELEQGLNGVQMALKVLNEYYGGKPSNDGSSSGIIGLIEVVESDFSKGLAEMTAVEETAQRSYETEMKEIEIERVTKEQDVSYKTKESAELDKSAVETKTDRTSSQAELDAVAEYLKKVEGECIAKAETFEERTQRAHAELSGLKEALRVLSEEAASALIQRRSSTKLLRGVRRHLA